MSEKNLTKELKNLVYLDTETTGVNEEDRLCQVAYRMEGENYESLFKPPLPIKVESSAVCHITNKMVEDKENFDGSEMKSHLIDLFSSDENVMVAHNAKFDIRMLVKDGVEVPQFIDTLKVAQALDPQGAIPRYNLQYLRYFLELEVPGAQAHDALGDVLVLEKLFERLYMKMKDSGKSYDEIISEMKKISMEPVLIKKFNFGKHKDKTVADVSKEDPGYLQWFLKQKEQQKAEGDIDEDWLHTLEFYLK